MGRSLRPGLRGTNLLIREGRKFDVNEVSVHPRVVRR